MNAFQQAINQNYQLVLSITGVPVTYHTTNGDTSLVAVVGRSQHEISSEWETMISSCRDYIFAVGNISPKVGDQIIEDGKIYEVNAPNGKDCFEFADPSKTWVRVHTQYIQDEITSE
jgi:hypothetical protein